ATDASPRIASCWRNGSWLLGPQHQHRAALTVEVAVANPVPLTERRMAGVDNLYEVAAIRRRSREVPHPNAQRGLLIGENSIVLHLHIDSGGRVDAAQIKRLRGGVAHQRREANED